MIATNQNNPTEPWLLTATQVMQNMGISPRQFYRTRNRLIALGLKTVQLNSSVSGGRPRTRYLASSLRKLIEHAAATETPLG